MKKIVDKKHILILTYLCTAVYFASYFARSDFAAVLTAFISDEGVNAGLAGLIITGAFFSYGIGQLLSGYLGDKVAPKWIVFVGFILTGVMNLLMPLASGNITQMIVIWVVNGLAHAMMWPPLAKILTNYLSATAYMRSTTTVCVGGSLGTLAVYLVSAWMVAASNWKSVMFIATAISFVMAVVWMAMMAGIEKYVKTYGAEEKITMPEGKKHSVGASLKNVHWKRAIALIMLAIIFQGYLRDGIATWLPQYLQDVFAIEISGSLLITILLPLFNVVMIEVCSWLYRNVMRNETVCAAVYFGVVRVVRNIRTRLKVLYYGAFSPVLFEGRQPICIEKNKNHHKSISLRSIDFKRSGFLSGQGTKRSPYCRMDEAFNTEPAQIRRFKTEFGYFALPYRNEGTSDDIL